MLCKAFYTCPGNLSAGPITIGLIVLINRNCGHFIPPASPPLISALYCPSYALPISGFQCVAARRSDTSLEHVSCCLPEAILPKVC